VRVARRVLLRLEERVKVPEAARARAARRLQGATMHAPRCLPMGAAAASQGGQHASGCGRGARLLSTNALLGISRKPMLVNTLRICARTCARPAGRATRAGPAHLQAPRSAPGAAHGAEAARAPGGMPRSAP